MNLNPCLYGGGVKRKFVTQDMVLAHLRRRAEAGRPKSRRATLYIIGGTSGPVKIGYTTDLSKRFAAIQAHSPIKLSVLASVDGRGSELETIYHHRFAEHRLHGEWFERCPEIEAEIERLSNG